MDRFNDRFDDFAQYNGAADERFNDICLTLLVYPRGLVCHFLHVYRSAECWSGTIGVELREQLDAGNRNG